MKLESRVAGLLILAGVLFRLWATGQARFTYEESLFWSIARDIALGRDLPLYGPPLTGSAAHHPGPLFYYLVALPQSLGADPRLGGGFVAILHGVAAALLYGAFRRAGGARAGLFALALWLFAPWDVLYADRIWLSCVAPVWGTATLYAAVRASESTKWQGALLFFCVGAPQLHMSAPIVWAAAAAWLYLRPPERWSKAALLTGLGLGALIYLPTLWFELTHDLENTRMILRKSRGKAGAITLVNSPLRVFGNAVLASTSEIAYHFETGYWGGFDERKTYILPSGWLAWLRFHGWRAPLNLVSLALGFYGWFASVRGLVRRARALEPPDGRGVRAWLRRLRGLQMQDHLTLMILVGLLAATFLLIVSRKGYYPHYSNLLVPFVLWPVAQTLAAAGPGRRRGLLWTAAGVSVCAMAIATTRYYRTVDALNGLETSKQIVRALLDEGAPVKVELTGFDNREAWKNLAEGYFGEPLRLSDDAQILWRFENDAPRAGPTDEAARAFGPVRATRRGP